MSGEVFRSIFNARRPSTDPSMRSTLRRDRCRSPESRYRGGHADATTPLRLGRRRRAVTRPPDGRLPRRRMGNTGRRRHGAVRAARPRILPGGPVVVDDPAEAGELSRGVRRLRPSGGRRDGRCRRRTAYGRCRDRPEPRQDPGDDRQRPSVPGDRRGIRDHSGHISRASCPGLRRACRRMRPRARSQRRRRPRTACRPTCDGADSSSSARRSSTRSCRASGSSTTTFRAASDIGERS